MKRIRKRIRTNDPVYHLMHQLMYCMIIAAIIIIAFAPCVHSLGLGTLEDGLSYTADQTSSIKYFLITGEGEDLAVSFDFEGDLADYAAFRIDNYWYSTRVDKLNVNLTQEFDLTNISSATLTFQTKYSIEYGWDFGYVEISINNGSSWSQLAGTGTTTYRDGGAYVGVPGAPAYTGAVSDWTLETIDLTPYTGNIVLLRFRYLTDDYYAEHGWDIDDIRIDAIGFFDDVQGSTTGWVSKGWLKDILHVNSTTKRTEVFIDFVIPGNYTYNDTEEKVTVTEIAGVEGDFNSAQGSVAKIIAKIPSVIKVVPQPPVPPGGSGGGGGTTPPYFAKRIANAVTYIISNFEPHTEYKMRSTMAESIVKSIMMVLKSKVNDAAVQVNPLDSRPVWIKKDIPDVYRYFEVSTLKIYDKDIDRAVLEVSVEKDWLRDKSAAPDDIVVTRYNNGRWSDLPTVRSGEDSAYYSYEATSPGFSVFVVRLRSPLEPYEIITPVPTAKPDVSQIKKITVVAGDEDIEDVLSEEKSKLRQKVGLGDDVELSVPLVERPGRPMWMTLLVVSLMMLAIIAIIVAITFKASEKEKISEKESKKSVHVRKRKNER